MAMLSSLHVDDAVGVALAGPTLGSALGVNHELHRIAVIL